MRTDWMKGAWILRNLIACIGFQSRNNQLSKRWQRPLNLRKKYKNQLTTAFSIEWTHLCTERWIRTKLRQNALLQSSQFQTLWLTLWTEEMAKTVTPRCLDWGRSGQSRSPTSSSMTESTGHRLSSAVLWTRRKLITGSTMSPDTWAPINDEPLWMTGYLKAQSNQSLYEFRCPQLKERAETDYFLFTFSLVCL